MIDRFYCVGDLPLKGLRAKLGNKYHSEIYFGKNLAEEALLRQRLYFFTF